jgi:hypothetical protein
MSNYVSRLAPLWIVLFFLSGCASGVVPSDCPPPRDPGAEVAEELEAVPFEGFEDFWRWMADVETLNRQLDACR